MAGRADGQTNPVADPSRPPSERTRLGGASALVAAVALVAVPGESAVVAVLGALAVLAAWQFLTPAYAFALGHVALAAVLPEGVLAGTSGLVRVAAVEVGLVGTLLASAVESSSGESAGVIESVSSGRASASRAAVAAGLVLGWVALGAVLARASARPSLGVATAGVALVVPSALAAYGLHRYQLVSLGLVADDSKADEDGAADETGPVDGGAPVESDEEGSGGQDGNGGEGGGDDE